MQDISEKIPCLDLQKQHQSIKEEVFEAFEKVYAKTAFSGGPFVAEFEEKFAEFCGTKYAVAVNNGTNSLHIAMMALGIKAGDEVILPANTFIATAWAISYVGAIPVFVDCFPETWEIDTKKVEEAITQKTTAIVGVHLYGQPCDVEGLSRIAENHNLFFIEDAAQAQGAKFNGKHVGSFGNVACFSFYPGKNLGACGEGGAVTTNDEELVKKMHRLRNHGCEERYYHDELGFNMRMGGLEGASLKIKLKYLDGWNNRRREIAKSYLSQINNNKIKLQFQPDNTDSIFHLFVITVENREEFIEYLNKHQIYPGLHYPVPCHLQKAYAHLKYKKGDMPHSEYLSEHCVSLPMYAELNDDEVSKVIEVVNQY